MHLIALRDINLTFTSVSLIIIISLSLAQLQ